jgi:hypothetical protein
VKIPDRRSTADACSGTRRTWRKPCDGSMQANRLHVVTRWNESMQRRTGLTRRALRAAASTGSIRERRLPSWSSASPR